MPGDPIRGKTLRWSYDDGPMRGKTFEHAFGTDGVVSWKIAGEKGPAEAGDSQAKYEVARVSDDIYAVAYLARSGFTLTTILDLASGMMVSFASNEKELFIQRGTFEIVEQEAQSPAAGRR